MLSPFQAERRISQCVVRPISGRPSSLAAIVPLLPSRLRVGSEPLGGAGSDGRFDRLAGLFLVKAAVTQVALGGAERCSVSLGGVSRAAVRVVDAAGRRGAAARQMEWAPPSLDVGIREG